jgi:hypothetical protein
MIEAARRVAVGIGMGQAVEQPPRAGCTVWSGFPHPLDLPHLQWRRAACVGDDPVFGLGMGEADRLAALREQVDDRRAAEDKVLSADDPLEFEDCPVEINEDLEMSAIEEQCLAVHSGEVNEQEFLRQRKIFGQQAKPCKTASRPGQQLSSAAKSGRFDRRRRDDRGVGIAGAFGIGDADRMATDQLVERQRDVGRAAKEEAQAIDAKAGETGGCRGAVEDDAQYRSGAVDDRVRQGGERQARQLCTGNRQRPQRDRPGGAETTGLAMHGLGLDGEAPGEADRQRQIRLQPKLHDRRGGTGAR